MLIEEIEDSTNRWKEKPCSWIGRINTVKMIILPKAIYRLKAILIKLPMTFFTELEQKIPTICMETQKTLNSQSKLEKECTRGIRLPGFRLYYKAIVTNTVWHQNKNRHIAQQNQIETPEINPHTYSQSMTKEGAKIIKWWKYSLINK